MMHLDLVEGMISRNCGSLKGTSVGGLHSMLMIVEHGYNMPGEVRMDVYTRGPRKKKTNKEMEDIIRQLYASIIEESWGNNILLHQLLILLTMQRDRKEPQE